MTDALPLWLDVRPSGYPVFNTQRPFGGATASARGRRSSAPTSTRGATPRSGRASPATASARTTRCPAEGESFGLDENFTGGTIIGLGGHLHPGGLRNEVDLVRNGQAQRIYTGIPTYWDPDDKTKGGGPPDSWDFSMRVSGLPKYGVHVEPGDALRSNAAYDTTIQSTYENMGIVVALLVPEDDGGNKQAPGVNPFTAPVDDSKRCDSGGLLAATPTLCTNGMLETHGHYKENAYRGGAAGSGRPPAAGPMAGRRPRSAIADFVYAPGDLSTAPTLGVPKVPLGTEPALHEPRRRGDPAHDHSVQVPVSRPDRGGVPARRRPDEPGPADRARLGRARLRRAGDQRREERGSTGRSR